MGLKTNIEMQNTQKLWEWAKEFLESIILFLNSMYLNFYILFVTYRHSYGIYVVADLKIFIFLFFVCAKWVSEACSVCISATG
jgi:hypothetical protein